MRSTIGAIVLASGRSQRFGTDNKLLVDWDGTPLISRALSLAKNCRAVSYVTAIISESTDTQISALWPKWQWPTDVKKVINQTPEKGLSCSLKLGINALPHCDAWIICLADMPLVSSNTIKTLAQLPRASFEIAVPRYMGKQGNPARIDASLKEQVLSLKGDVGARQLIKSGLANPRFVDTNDRGILLDVDTRNDLHDITEYR